MDTQTLWEYDDYKKHHPTASPEDFLKEKSEDDILNFYQTAMAFFNGEDKTVKFKILDEEYTLCRGNIRILDDYEVDEEFEDV